jgi:hypothetical protein
MIHPALENLIVLPPKSGVPAFRHIKTLIIPIAKSSLIMMIEIGLSRN